MRDLVKRWNSHRRRHFSILGGEEGGRDKVRVVFLKGFVTFHAFVSPALRPISSLFVTLSKWCEISDMLGLMGRS